jgi:hypothetical protein
MLPVINETAHPSTCRPGIRAHLHVALSRQIRSKLRDAAFFFIEEEEAGDWA